MAHTLGHEIRKAAYTLNNLLPQPKRRPGLFNEDHQQQQQQHHISLQSEVQQCRDTCSGLSPNLGDLDGVRIPATVLEQAKGVAVLTVVKGGFGLAGVEFGTGLVVARLPAIDNNNNNINSATATTATPTPQSSYAQQPSFRWSAPSAIGMVGISWGALIGAQVSDHVFLLMSDAAVALLYSNTASVQLCVDVGVAVGPVEGDWAADGQSAAPIYTYSMSKGLYAGISLDGKVIATRAGVNEKFYGFAVSAQEILADAPAHAIFVLLSPSAEQDSNNLPDVLAVVQVALDGRISRKAMEAQLARGHRLAGDLIPWTLEQQFGDSKFFCAIERLLHCPRRRPSIRRYRAWGTDRAPWNCCTAFTMEK